MISYKEINNDLVFDISKNNQEENIFDKYGKTVDSKERRISNANIAKYSVVIIDKGIQALLTRATILSIAGGPKAIASVLIGKYLVKQIFTFEIALLDQSVKEAEKSLDDVYNEMFRYGYNDKHDSISLMPEGIDNWFKEFDKSIEKTLNQHNQYVKQEIVKKNTEEIEKRERHDREKREIRDKPVRERSQRDIDRDQYEIRESDIRERTA
jgi:hypothetical protein